MRGLLRIHRDVRAAGVLVDEQRRSPGLAAVGRAEDAALRLRPVGVAERAREHDVRIRRIDDEARDAAGLLEAHQRPGLAGVGGLVDALPDRDVAADAWPRRCRPRRRSGRTARRRATPIDGTGWSSKIGCPVHAAVGGLPDAARGRADVVDERIAGNARDRRTRLPFGPM